MSAMLTPYAKKMMIRLIVIGLVFINVTVYCSYYVGDLRARYPNMDVSRAHVGIASWYSESDKFINTHTANGERFDDDAATCATWNYPFHEKLLVVNLLNGKSVVCRVNDRGPAKRLHREIDLTKATFRKISHSKRGLIPVTVIPINKKTTIS